MIKQNHRKTLMLYIKIQINLMNYSFLARSISVWTIHLILCENGPIVFFVWNGNKEDSQKKNDHTPQKQPKT